MILVSAGHSDTDPGAVNKHGRKEADIARDMRNMVALYLRRDSNYRITTDGISMNNKPLREAVRLVGKGKDDIAIEFHCNAFHSEAARGTEALAQSKDKELSQILCKAVSEVMDTPVRGSDGGWKHEGSGQHSRLAFVRAGGIILELFFLTNPSELATWDAKKWLVAKRVAKEILLFADK
jgi:N-acetylmuramoyl-L-alanine amidase